MRNNGQLERNNSTTIRKKFVFIFSKFANLDLSFLQGYRWLVDNNLIENTSEHMAAFLLNEIGLSKRAIGEFLGEK